MDAQVGFSVDAKRGCSEINLLVRHEAGIPLQRESNGRVNLQTFGTKIVEVGRVRVVNPRSVGHRGPRIEQAGPGDRVVTDLFDRYFSRPLLCRHGAQSTTSISSTSKINTELGGILSPAPRSP